MEKCLHGIKSFQSYNQWHDSPVITNSETQPNYDSRSNVEDLKSVILTQELV